MAHKFLFKPLDTLSVGQHFGENLACIPLKGGSLISCNGLKPPAGYKSVYSNMNGHNGTDLNVGYGMPIYSCQDGIVEEWVSEKERGIGLGIITTRKFYCDEVGKEVYWKIRYWHQSYNLVNLGDTVSIGTVLCLAGSTGYSTGVHLHIEGKPVDVKFNKDGSIKSVKNILQNNNYFGAVNLFPYFLDQNASEFTKYKSWKERLVYALLKYLK